MTSDLASVVDAAADLARRSSELQCIDIEPPGVLVHVTRSDERVNLVDYQYLLPQPQRASGVTTLHDPSDFATYVGRLANAGTVVFADGDNRRLVAVLNDHCGPAEPGWRDHAVVLALQPDPDWSAWTGADGKLTDQLGFAEFLETYATDVVSPDATTMLEVALTFRARRTASFEQNVKLDSRDVAFAWSEETKAASSRRGEPVEVPREFAVRLAPYLGWEPADLVARLRWDISREGVLRIGYRLIRPDAAARAAFGTVCAWVAAALPEGVPLLRGQAPIPLPAAARPSPDPAARFSYTVTACPS